MFDLENFFMVEAPARLRSQIAEADLPTIGTADNVEEALLADSPVPSVYGIYNRGAAKVIHGGRRLVVGRRNQVKTMRFVFAVVTESYASREDGRLGAWNLMARVADALTGWRSTGMLSKIEFVADRFVLRTPDSTRVLHEVEFEADAEVFTTPAPP